LFDPYPQILKNFEFVGANPLDNPDVQEYLKKIELETADQARISVRKSGTEPLIRVMAEGKNRQFLDELIDGIIKKIS
jgi:phosphoglucosamine mutase